MQKTVVQLPQIKLIGITARTNNEAEKDLLTVKISPTVQRYFREALPEKIPHRKTPGVTYIVYTQYESDFSGDYTCFIGEVVTFFEEATPGFEQLLIPAQDYIKFTCGPDKMPDVCIHAWQQIWSMTPALLGGKRSYMADFEVYDERSADPKHTILDIYIGICHATV